MTRFQRVSWFAIVLVTLVTAGFLVPLWPALGPSTRTLATDTVMTLQAASLTFPAGWDVSIEAASQSQPSVERGDVRVGTADALWLGSSASLVDNVVALVFSGEPTLPQIPADAKGAEREVWEITAGPDAADDDPRRVVVVRQEQSVVLIIVRGPAAAVAAEKDAIDAIVASVSLDSVGLDVDVAS